MAGVLFVQEPRDDLKCAICHDAAYDPILCHPLGCATLFCRQCMDHYLGQPLVQGVRLCPHCRMELHQKDLMEDKRARREVRDLKVVCPTCSDKMTWSTLRESHLCPNVLVSCPAAAGGCNVGPLRRSDLSSHLVDPNFAVPHAVAPVRAEVEVLKTSQAALLQAVEQLQLEVSRLREEVSAGRVLQEQQRRLAQCPGYKEARAIVRMPGQPMATVVLRYDKVQEGEQGGGGGAAVPEVVDLKMCANCYQSSARHQSN